MKAYLKADDVAEIIGKSKCFSYKIIRQLNSELEKKNFIVVAGQISTRYFEEKYYGLPENYFEREGNSNVGS